MPDNENVPWFMRRKVRLYTGLTLLAVTLVGWPLSVIFTDEPVFILSLSWFALTLTSYDIISTNLVEK